MVYFQKCPKDFFTCKKGKITCIQTEFVCDCSPDCDDSSDEDKTWGGCTKKMECSAAAGKLLTSL
ncbi:hypothetical protein DPMN_140697 [Dreissena polymorpha]|uniref:Uncharacterized protein n=1 Tax=Dreissena polymorpha TaxID=45954 RepID=A0A9D4JGX2_DREPO|nr:hypothetical protein DPMN_140697 [Dreissena polymorpha]